MLLVAKLSCCWEDSYSIEKPLLPLGDCCFYEDSPTAGKTFLSPGSLSCCKEHSYCVRKPLLPMGGCCSWEDFATAARTEAVLQERLCCSGGCTVGEAALRGKLCCLGNCAATKTLLPTKLPWTLLSLGKLSCCWEDHDSVGKLLLTL